MPKRQMISALVLAVMALGMTAATGARAQAVAGWTDAQLAKRMSQYTVLDPAMVAAAVTTEDDDLEPTATLSTAKIFTFKGGFTDRVRADNFLRAFISKKTGAVTYQVYERLIYSGEWRRFDMATFATPQGPIAARIEEIDHKATCINGQCAVYTDTLGFAVDEPVLREIASHAAERPVKPWRFRFKAANGVDWTDDMAPAEIAGLLLAVDRYRAVHQLR